jgi:ABC-type nitrate/sulfonate/bicarbonate transport system substrate-binding protein
MMNFRLPRLLSAALLTLAVSVVAGNAQETVRYATDGYGMGALAIIASDQGILEKEGIKPVVQTYSYGVDTVDAVLAGNADFGVIIDFPLLTRFAAGKLMSPAIIAEPLPGWHKLYTRADLEIPAGLKGKSIGVATGTAQEFVTRTYLTDGGLNPDQDVQMVGFSSLFEIVGAMKAGRIDAAWIWGEGVATIDADEGWKFIADDGIVNQSTSALLVTTKEYYANNKDTVVRTLRGFQKASEYLGANLDAAADQIAKKVGGDAAQIKNVVSQQRYGLTFGPRAMSSLKAKYDFLVKAGKIEPYDFAAQFDTSALKEAMPSVEVDPMLK